MPCDCDQECEPGTGPEILTRGASKILGVRVTKGFARELSKACSTAGCTQSDMLRLGLAQLAKASGPDEQLAAVRDALGLDADAARAAIVTALDAIFAITGDAATADVDPIAAAAEPKPPANALAASKLTSEQIAALARRKLPATQAAWAALCKSAARTVGAAPARAAAPALAAAKAAPARPAPARPMPFTREQLAYASKHSIPASQLRAHLAARAAKAVRK